MAANKLKLKFDTKRKIKSRIINCILRSDYEWFDEDCKVSNGERDDYWADFIAKDIINEIMEAQDE